MSFCALSPRAGAQVLRPPVVSFEHAQQGADGVYISPYDNPAVVVEMPLDVVDIDGDGDLDVAQEVTRTQQTQGGPFGAQRLNFEAAVTSTCDPSDLLCVPTTQPGEPPYWSLWYEGQELAVSALNQSSVPLVARGLRVGGSVSTVEVTKKQTVYESVSSTAQVRIDPETLVVPVNVIYVVPSPATVVSTPEEQFWLEHALDRIDDVDLTIDDDGMGGFIAGGGTRFAENLLDSVPHNSYFSSTHPGEPSIEQETFLYQARPNDSNQLGGPQLLTSTGTFWDLPDPVFAQCGIQFRLQSVKVILEDDPARLYLDRALHDRACGNLSGNVANLKGALDDWRTQAGIDPVDPGIELVFLPRVDAPEEDDQECRNLGLSEAGFALIPYATVIDRVRSTVTHELTHALGLNDLGAHAQCANPATNLLCNVSGPHIAGCDTWRADGVVPQNCFAEPDDPSFSITYTCAGARMAAAAVAGEPASAEPVACPAPPLDVAPAAGDMMDPGAIGEVAAYGGSQLRINDRARLLATNSTYDFGPFATGISKGDVRVGTDAKLARLVTDGSPAEFTHRYVIDEILAASDAYMYAQDGANLELITTRGVTVPGLRVDTANFPRAKTASILLEPEQDFPGPGFIVTPGQYVGDVVLKRDSVLRLGAGRYFMDSLDVQSGGRLLMDHSAGHVEIYVRGRLYFQGKFSNAGGERYANYFVVTGTQPVQINAPFEGRVVAPKASIILENFVHDGAFYAGGSLQLHQGGAIRYRPLVCNDE